jgi:uncharacterized protein (DUF4415 family)
MNAQTTQHTEMTAFEQDLLESVRQAITGNFVGDSIAYTPNTIETIKRRGRPTQSIHKQATTLRLDNSTLAKWRATGKGWQTRAAMVLSQHAPA